MGARLFVLLAAANEAMDVSFAKFYFLKGLFQKIFEIILREPKKWAFLSRHLRIWNFKISAFVIKKFFFASLKSYNRSK